MFSPSIRLAVVTGAASGIGLATVSALLMDDDTTRVVGVDVDGRPPSLLDSDRIDWVQGDVSAPATWSDVQRAIDARDPLGADCLIACAARQVVAPFLQQGDSWQRLFEVNVMGVVRALEAVVPAMLTRGRGSIAIVCSITSFDVVEGLGAYSASKAALLQVMRTAALEFANKGIRVNGVCPGFVDTPLLQRHMATLPDPAGAYAGAAQRVPMGRILDPNEVASVLTFLVMLL